MTKRRQREPAMREEAAMIHRNSYWTLGAPRGAPSPAKRRV
jgi:hypothetical protein